MTPVIEPWPLLSLMAITWSPCHIARDKWIPRWGSHLGKYWHVSLCLGFISFIVEMCGRNLPLWVKESATDLFHGSIYLNGRSTFIETMNHIYIKLIKYLWRCSYLNMSGELVNILYDDDLAPWTSESPADMSLTMPDEWILVLHQEIFQPYASSIECQTGSSYDNPSLALNSHLSVDEWQEIRIFIYVFITMTSQWAR